MDGSATKEIQYTDQDTAKLHRDTAGNLINAGYPVEPHQVNPNPDHHLTDIERLVTGVIEESTSGQSPTTHVGTTSGETPIKVWFKRRFGKAA